MTAPALILTLTRAGHARFAAAQLGEPVDLRVAQLGLTDTPFVAAPTIDALPGEFRRVGTLSGSPVGDNIVHLILRDDDAVSYEARGFGLYFGDGTLFAVYGQPDPLFGKSAQVSFMAAIDIAFPDATAAQVSFGDTTFLNPPATTATPGVALIASQADVEAATDAAKIVTPRTLGSRLAELATSLLAHVADTVADYIPLAQRGAAGGVAQLDGGGTVPLAQLPLTRLLPARTVMLYFGAVAPAGWAICDGSTVQLADGSGPITTPDLRGRVAVGASDAHGVGSAFGQSTVDLDTGSATTGVTLQFSKNSGFAGGGTQTAVSGAPLGADPALTDPGHTHEVSFDVTQPSFALHYIIKL